MGRKSVEGGGQGLVPLEDLEDFLNEPVDQEVVTKLAYRRWLDRVEKNIPGDEKADWFFALEEVSVKREWWLFNRHMDDCTNPKKRIRFAAVIYLAMFWEMRPSQIRDDMQLDGMPLLTRGPGLTATCGGIGVRAKVGDLKVPEKADTVGELIAGLQSQIRR
jgi:hypothetical protein